MTDYLLPFPSTSPPAEGARVPLDSKAGGFVALAAGQPKYAPPGICNPLDLAELTRQASVSVERAVAALVAAGLRAETLPGRLDVLPWYVEFIAAGLVQYDLPLNSAYDVLEGALPDFAKSLAESALTKAYEGTFFEPGTASKSVAAARVAKDAARKAAREAMALQREVVARKVAPTPAQLGCHVIRWAVTGDRTQATPFLLQGGLDVSDGTTLFAVAPGHSAGLDIKGTVAGADWELVPADDELPGLWTGAQWAQALAANTRLPEGLWSAIVQARKASTDLGPMSPEGGLDEDSLVGRAAIALGVERLRMMKSANMNLFGVEHHSQLQLQATIEWLSRGLDLNVLVCRDILCESQFGDSKPRGYGDTADWFVRTVLKSRAQGSYLSPGECLPEVEGIEQVSSGDAYEDILRQFTGDEVLQSDAIRALRAAGIAGALTNLFTGRITKVMSKLGFRKQALSIAGKLEQAYVRVHEISAKVTDLDEGELS